MFTDDSELCSLPVVTLSGHNQNTPVMPDNVVTSCLEELNDFVYRFYLEILLAGSFMGLPNYDYN